MTERALDSLRILVTKVAIKAANGSWSQSQRQLKDPLRTRRWRLSSISLLSRCSAAFSPTAAIRTAFSTISTFDTKRKKKAQKTSVRTRSSARSLTRPIYPTRSTTTIWFPIFWKALPKLTREEREIITEPSAIKGSWHTTRTYKELNSIKRKTYIFKELYTHYSILFIRI